MEELLRLRELDEVPLFSRDKRITFLSHLSTLEQSEVLVVEAIRYLGHISKFVEDNNRTDVFAMVSITDWDDSDAVPSEVIHPNF